MARRGNYGYDCKSVDAFFDHAKTAYENSNAIAEESITSALVRQVAFRVRKKGYVTADVDSALERLEDYFARRENQARYTQQQYCTNLGLDIESFEKDELLAALQTRMARPTGHRFRRVNFIAQGYRIVEVDWLVTRLSLWMSGEQSMNANEVRQAVFAPQRGGYSEVQVDLVLDTVVEQMLRLENEVPVVGNDFR